MIISPFNKKQAQDHPAHLIYKKEITLDCDSSSRAVKGHFSSLLLSNIIGYLSFLQIWRFPFVFETYLASRFFFVTFISLQREALLCGSVSLKGVRRFGALLSQMILFCRLILTV